MTAKLDYCFKNNTAFSGKLEKSENTNIKSKRIVQKYFIKHKRN